MSIMVSALAGTGKTFALVGGVKYLHNIPSDLTPSKQQNSVWQAMKNGNPPGSICFTAFTVSARDTIIQRIPKSLKCKITTMSALGYQIIRNETGQSGELLEVDKYKTDHILEKIHGKSAYALRQEDSSYMTAVNQLVKLSKYDATDCPSSRKLENFAGEYDISLGEDADRIFESVRDVLDLARQDCQTIDFDDMLWLPLVLEMKLPHFDRLIIDEGQDLNHCQQLLALAMSDDITIAGDKHQAIFGFAGADTRSMSTMYEQLNGRDNGCSEHPLTVSYRCSQRVVETAQQIVPEFSAHYSNPEGSVSFKPDFPAMTPGNLILCRTNAPLIRTAFQLVAENIPVEILGRRSICSTLTTLIQSINGDNIPDLCTKLGRYQRKEEQRLTRVKARASSFMALKDKCQCLSILATRANSIPDMIRQLNSLFSQKNNSIILSSIHQAKGREADNVVIIRPDLLPHPMAKSEWELDQEKNLEYVAITRARINLTYVGEKDN